MDTTKVRRSSLKGAGCHLRSGDYMSEKESAVEMDRSSSHWVCLVVMACSVHDLGWGPDPEMIENVNKAPLIRHCVDDQLTRHRRMAKGPQSRER